MRAFFSSRQGLVLPSIILTAPPSAARITRAKRRAAAVVDGKTKLCIARADSKEESLLPLREKDAKAWRGEAEPSRSWMRGRAPKGARARKSAPVALTRCAPSARPPHPAPAKLTSFAKPAQPSPSRGEGVVEWESRS